MARAQLGFVYEGNSLAQLKDRGIGVGTHAGGGDGQPDISIQNLVGRASGVEMKMGAASGGSQVVKFINGEWKLPEPGTKKSAAAEAKRFLYDIVTQLGILDMIRKNWGAHVPCLQHNERGRKMYVGKTKDEAYAEDFRNFEEFDEPVETEVLRGYYKRKGCDYINIGTRGFFTLGDDPLGLNTMLAAAGHDPVPVFEASCRIRVRVQYKGKDNYQFTIELSFGEIAKSPYNIAPIVAGTADIDVRRLDEDVIVRLLTRT